MDFNIEKYEITTRNGFRLSAFDTKPEVKISKKESKEIIKANVEVIADFQERMFANQKRSALIVFQAMDGAGKDGTIQRLVTGVNPQGVRVDPFKAPTALELRHDFLWRIQKKLPPRGIIGIFNRSHYEEVLVVRVHPSYLLPQDLPGIETIEDVNDSLWERRFDRISNFEHDMAETGTSILKFFLHISKEEQKNRMLDRIGQPTKHWKFNLDDIKERMYWDKYMHAFEDAIANTSQPDAPWYIIPGDDKYFARALVTTIVAQRLGAIKEPWPEADAQKRDEIDAGEEMLESE